MATIEQYDQAMVKSNDDALKLFFHNQVPESKPKRDKYPSFEEALANPFHVPPDQHLPKTSEEMITRLEADEYVRYQKLGQPDRWIRMYGSYINR